ncbi:MAG: PEP-utilizing enzyme [Candidatus Berkelbacteria bacterium]|nr:PEP-utilizing enzyme [Candidatus Berkelbacteria bacterium]
MRGSIAFKGCATGKVVKLPSGDVDLSKIRIKRGDIVITTMTSTNTVPLVKKAAGIITDEGGLLCHAAIISRELEKPCIVGTKFATECFSNNDIVELNANKGTVKLIKKAAK